jgi:hypothetical protein
MALNWLNSYPKENNMLAQVLQALSPIIYNRASLLVPARMGGGQLVL